MLRERAKLFQRFAQFVDLLIISLSFLIAYYVRGYLLTHWLSELFYFKGYLWLLIIILPSWWILLKSQGLYDSRRTRSLTMKSWIIIKTALIGTLVIGAIFYSLKFQHMSRTLVFTFAVISTAMLIGEQFIIRFSSKAIRKKGKSYCELLIVGTGEKAIDLAQKIMEHKWWGYRIVGFVDKDPEMVGRKLLGTYVIGTLDDIPKLIKERVIDEVIFSVPTSWMNDLERPIYACEEVGVETKVATNFFNPLIAKSYLDDLGGVPLLTFSTTPQKVEQLLVKQLFDTVASFTLLVFLSPVFLILILVIKIITSPGPAFFKQTRCGLNGREFNLYKFRSMVEDAEEMKTDLEELNEQDGPAFKIKYDPRVTPIGRFIRKTSIDEIPQLLNVLKGDMSFVGPRPPLPSEVDGYERWQRRRLSMKPGITCIWQVSGRNKVDFDTWMKMDLEYIDNWSLSLDLKITLRTIPAVLFSKGAM